MNKKNIRYWLDDGDCFYNFKTKQSRDDYAQQIRNKRTVPLGYLRIFETETIYEGDINKYKRIKKHTK